MKEKMEAFVSVLGGMLISGAAGFVSGWLVRSCTTDKTQGHAAAVKGYTTYNDDRGSHLKIRFTNGEELNIDAETVEEQA